MLKRFRTFEKFHINPAFLYVSIIKPKHTNFYHSKMRGKCHASFLMWESKISQLLFWQVSLHIIFQTLPTYYTWKLQGAVTICWLIDIFLLDTVWLLPSRSWFWHELMDLAIKKEMTVLCVCCFEKEVLSRPFETLHHPCRHFHSFHSIAKQI